MAEELCNLLQKITRLKTQNPRFKRGKFLRKIKFALSDKLFFVKYTAITRTLSNVIKIIVKLFFTALDFSELYL